LVEEVRNLPGLPEERTKQLRGAVFEARQGYKSADAKRQAADLRFAMNASIENYLPVLSIVSTQASMAVIRRYKNAKMLVITGILADDDMISTYAFFRKIVGFELDAFFQRNTDAMRKRCQKVLAALLTRHSTGLAMGKPGFEPNPGFSFHFS
jgi:hypothetical protein